MAHDAGLQARLRTLLAGRPDVEEKRMVGGMSFVVGGHLCVGVKGEALLVRVGPAADEAALAEPGVSPLEFGGRHPLGYVLVEPAHWGDVPDPIRHEVMTRLAPDLREVLERFENWRRGRGSMRA